MKIINIVSLQIVCLLLRLQLHPKSPFDYPGLSRKQISGGDNGEEKTILGIKICFPMELCKFFV